jgi:hypothetical protein
MFIYVFIYFRIQKRHNHYLLFCRFDIHLFSLFNYLSKFYLLFINNYVSLSYTESLYVYRDDIVIDLSYLYFVRGVVIDFYRYFLFYLFTINDFLLKIGGVCGLLFTAFLLLFIPLELIKALSNILVFPFDKLLLSTCSNLILYFYLCYLDFSINLYNFYFSYQILFLKQSCLIEFLDSCLSYV